MVPGGTDRNSTRPKKPTLSIHTDSSFGSFKKDALGIDRSNTDEIQKHFLRGAWMDGTLKHYNSGVVKLLRFAEVRMIDRSMLLPIAPEVLLSFVVWGSKKEEDLVENDESVKSTTLRSYIAGLKAWHKFHRKPYPSEKDETVALLLKASEMVEHEIRQAEKLRPPVMISDFGRMITRMQRSPSMEPRRQSRVKYSSSIYTVKSRS